MEFFHKYQLNSNTKILTVFQKHILNSAYGIDCSGKGSSVVLKGRKLCTLWLKKKTALIVCLKFCFSPLYVVS